MGGHSGTSLIWTESQFSKVRLELDQQTRDICPALDTLSGMTTTQTLLTLPQLIHRCLRFQILQDDNLNLRVPLILRFRANRCACERGNAFVFAAERKYS